MPETLQKKKSEEENTEVKEENEQIVEETNFDLYDKLFDS